MLWTWFVELSESLFGAGGEARDLSGRELCVSRQHEIRFWCLQCCEKQILRIGNQPADLATKRQIADGLLHTYFEKLLPCARETSGRVEEDHVISRAVSVYVALVGADYPQSQPGLFQDFIQLITDSHKAYSQLSDDAGVKSPAGLRLLTLCELFLKVLSQLDANFIRNELNSRSKEELDRAGVIKDCMREKSAHGNSVVEMVMMLLSSIVCGDLFSLEPRLAEVVGGSGSIDDLGWWIKLSCSALQVFGQLCVWVDIALLQEQRLRMFLELALDNKFGLVCCQSSIEAIHALGYKRMHYWAQFALYQRYGMIPLLLKSSKLFTLSKDFGIAYAQALNTVGLELTENIGFISKDILNGGISGTVVIDGLHHDQVNQMLQVGMTAEPSLEEQMKMEAMTLNDITTLMKISLEMFGGQNLQIAERIAPFIKDAVRIYRQRKNNVLGREVAAGVLQACYARVIIPFNLTNDHITHNLEQLDSEELVEDDGSEISEFIVCRKTAMQVFYKGFMLAVDLSVALEFVEHLTAKNDCTLQEYEAMLRLLACAWDCDAEFQHERIEVKTSLSLLFQKIASKILGQRPPAVPGKSIIPVPLIVSVLECVSRVVRREEPQVGDIFREFLESIVLPSLDCGSRRLFASFVRELLRAAKRQELIKWLGVNWITKLLNSGLLRTAPLDVGIPVDRVVRFEEDLGSSSNLYDPNNLVKVDEQIKLYEIVSCWIPVVSIDVCRALVQSIGSQNLVPIQPGTMSVYDQNRVLEYAQRQLRCFAGLLKKVNYNGELTQHVLQLTCGMYKTYLGYPLVSLASIPVFRRVCKTQEQMWMACSLVCESLPTVVVDGRRKASGAALRQLCQFFQSLIMGTTKSPATYIFMAPAGNPQSDICLILHVMQAATSVWREMYRSSGVSGMTDKDDSHLAESAETFGAILDIYIRLSDQMPLVTLLCWIGSDEYSLTYLLGSAAEVVGMPTKELANLCQFETNFVKQTLTHSLDPCVEFASCVLKSANPPLRLPAPLRAKLEAAANEGKLSKEALYSTLGKMDPPLFIENMIRYVIMTPETAVDRLHRNRILEHITELLRAILQNQTANACWRPQLSKLFDGELLNIIAETSDKNIAAQTLTAWLIKSCK
ncbi:exportin 1-like protein [Gregarina niphandrodes]|uniref:Exportin-T n=1 Tax=Gregarina niphandrodes TaxID=110365 RepID=A0A023B641_GRENI|nr:exportin 1-like protein [Gregarina niphandrodes]EZG65387.1 exportin 1-like protein [Gregarina niphandrodes]|eukprot:XP_011134086.1 exportin 1-like protein [Gregarina niphandrodes]